MSASNINSYSNGAVALDLTEESDVDSPMPIDRPPTTTPAVSKKKTALAVAILGCAMLSNNCALAWIHERVPRNATPLPDLWYSLFPEIPWTIHIAEPLQTISMLITILTIVFHQHRWIVLRRLCLIAAICYAYRAVCISIIQVPVPSVNTYCAPPATDANLGLVLQRVFGLAFALGMELYRPRQLCGDLIVSGHTLTLILSWLFVRHYVPRRGQNLSYLLAFNAVVAVCSILLARKHYCIDIVTGYFISTRVFCSYHAIAQDPKSPMNYTFWAPTVSYWESDAPAPLHNSFQSPSSCFGGKKSKRRF